MLFMESILKMICKDIYPYIREIRSRDSFCPSFEGEILFSFVQSMLLLSKTISDDKNVFGKTWFSSIRA